MFSPKKESCLNGMERHVEPLFAAGPREAAATLDELARTERLKLRDKALPTPELVTLARRLRQRVQAAGGLFIVNDRVDVALASEADGVHLGPDDLSPADTRRLLGPDKIVGVSTGTVEEAEAAAPYASYFGVGAIFGTRTKSDAGDPIGVERIREIKAAFPSIPIVAIGGITADNIADVSGAGAEAAAVVSAVVGAPEMEAATRNMVALFMQAETRMEG